MKTDKYRIPVEKNMDLELEISSLTDDGSGVGRYHGFTLMVPGALPGEKVRAHVIKIQKSYAIAKLTEILQASPERVEPECPVYDKCGGCQWMHMAYPHQLTCKRDQVVSCLRRIGHISEDVLPDEKILPVLGMEEWHHYRNKAQYPVQSIDGKLRSGFYAPHSHRLVPSDTCLIQSEKAVRLMPQVLEIAEKLQMTAYDEISGKGELRHILIRDDEETGEVSLCLVINAGHLSRKDEWIREIDKLGIQSFSVNINRTRSNVILGPTTKIVYGQPYMTAKIGDLQYHVSPVSFFQVNSLQVKVLYDRVRELLELENEDILWDAYCGAGTIGLYMARDVRKVYGVEIVPEAVENARENARLNHIGNAEFFVGKAEEIMPEKISQGLRAGKVVVDPPRSGCEKALLDALLQMKPERIVYVSCNPSTLARDLEYLLIPGTYQISLVQPVDMFPASGHVETIAALQRMD